MQTDILKKKGVNKYLVFDSIDENKELIKKYSDVWNGIKNEIKTIKIKDCMKKKIKIKKDYMKIKLNSDDDLPLNKPLKFRLVTITIRYVFEEDGKLYQVLSTLSVIWQVFLDDALYELSIEKC